jgi:hypothetical protein
MRRPIPVRRPMLERRSPTLFRSSSVRLSIPLRRSRPERRPIFRFSFSGMGTPRRETNANQFTCLFYVIVNPAAGFPRFMRNKCLLKHSSCVWKGRCYLGLLASASVSVAWLACERIAHHFSGLSGVARRSPSFGCAELRVHAPASSSFLLGECNELAARLVSGIALHETAHYQPE